MTLAGAEKGFILKLEKDGKEAKIYEVDSEYKEKWEKVLKIYFSDMSDEEKKKLEKSFLKIRLKFLISKVSS